MSIENVLLLIKQFYQPENNREEFEKNLRNLMMDFYSKNLQKLLDDGIIDNYIIDYLESGLKISITPHNKLRTIIL